MAGHRRDRGTPLAVETRAARRRDLLTRRLADAADATTRLAVAYTHLLGTLKRVAHDRALRDDAASRAERALTAIADDTWRQAAAARKGARR